MKQLTQQIIKLISSYQSWFNSLKTKEETTTVHVDEVASKVAAFYEKIRGVIDWKEEHLLKRSAIERMLRRRFFTKMDLLKGGFSQGISENIAEPLVLELVRGGHFPNDKIEESKIKEIQKILNKYVFILNHAANKKKKSQLRLYDWLISLCTCEIEEILSSAFKERALINYMFEAIRERIKLSKGINITEVEKNIQIYIAVQRSLFNLDPALISYHLLRYWYYPEWQNLSQAALEELSDSIYLFWNKIENVLNHPLADKFFQICEKYDTAYLLIGDIISENPSEVEKKISDPVELEGLIKKSYSKRLRTLKSRLGRAAIYATLSIFITKIIFLLSIEMAVSEWTTGQLDKLAVAVNILTPTLLMAFLVLTIKPPKKGNLERVIIETMKIVYERETQDTYEIKPYPKRSFILDLIVKTLYFFGFLLFIGVTIEILYRINFPPFSYVVFIIFLALVSFAGTRIRQRSKELQMTEEKETLFQLIIDIFAIPIVQLGRWLTNKWKRYNVLSAIFNALIDLPFSLFVEFLEQWRYFLKEKKEKIH